MTTLKEGRVVTGMFRDRESAERAYNSAIDRGYTKDDVTVLMSDDTREKYFSDKNVMVEADPGNKAVKGSGVGGGIGAGLGALVLGILAAGAAPVVLPGLLVIGPLAGALIGAGAGGVTGGIIGGLVGAGIPEDRAKVYETGIQAGGIVLGINPHKEDDVKYFEDDWKKYHAETIRRS